MDTAKSTETGHAGDNFIQPFDVPSTPIYVEKITELSSKPVYTIVKRIFDILLSVVGIVVLFIPMLITYIIVKVTSKGNPIFKQERLGLNGKPFYIYKFRTMYEEAEENGAQWARGIDDDRVTPVGKVLRRIKFDEIPQLFNCLIGDLSLVGPRPEREIFYNHFETYVKGFSQRMLVKPGITGLAQLNGAYSLKPEEKIVYDIMYIKNFSFWLDVKILFKTIGSIIRDVD